MPDATQMVTGLPVTMTYASILGIIFLVLSIYVIIGRNKAHAAFGTGNNEDLERRIRIHGNFAEYVPICLILIGLLEAHGGYESLLYWLGGGLVIARISHIIALSMKKQPNIFRLVGTGGTNLVLLIASLVGLFEAI